MYMYIDKLVLFSAALILALLIGSTPAAAANPACDPVLFPTDDCDGDAIPNNVDTCDNLDPTLDCDADGVLNGVDECPATVLGEDLVVGACAIPGLDTILPTGCSLTESISEDLLECADGARNHGKYVSCVAKLTNALKKQKFITGAQKGQIQSCAAQTDTGKTPKP